MNGAGFAVTRERAVAVLAIDRPEKRNAMNAAM